MSEPPAHPPEGVVYLDVDDALEIFGAIIGGTATQAADQLRDRAALAGALARPINYAQYEHADLALQAATLAHGIAETQPFIDGNICDPSWQESGDQRSPRFIGRFAPRAASRRRMEVTAAPGVHRCSVANRAEDFASLRRPRTTRRYGRNGQAKIRVAP